MISIPAHRTLRVVSCCPWKGPAALSTSTCSRFLRGGFLIERVDIDGDCDGIPEAELEKRCQNGRIRFELDDQFADYNSLEASCTDYAWLITRGERI